VGHPDPEMTMASTPTINVRLLLTGS